MQEPRKELRDIAQLLERLETMPLEDWQLDSKTKQFPSPTDPVTDTYIYTPPIDGFLVFDHYYTPSGSLEQNIITFSIYLAQDRFPSPDQVRKIIQTRRTCYKISCEYPDPPYLASREILTRMKEKITANKDAEALARVHRFMASYQQWLEEK